MKIIAFDLETHRFEPGNMAPKPVCLSCSDGKHSGLIVGLSNIERWLQEHLGRALLVGHVVAYDCACILAHIPSVAQKVWDAYSKDLMVCTAIRERLLDIAQGCFRGEDIDGKWVPYGYDMADIARRRLGKDVAKGEDTWRTRYAELDGKPFEEWPEEAIKYAVTDAFTTHAMYSEQEQRAAEIHYAIPTQYEDSRADFALRLVSVWGLEVDLDRVVDLWDTTCARMHELAISLMAAGIAEKKKHFKPVLKGMPDIKKNLSVIRSLVEQHYPGPLPKTEKGAIITSKDVLNECKYEPLKQLVEFSELQKAAGTYISKLFTPIIHSRFFAVGSASDRTSSTGPNLQNLPRLPGIRECFTARKGKLLLACDYDSQEMRTLAQTCIDVCGWSRLAERFQADPHFDPHLEFAAQLAKCGVDEAKERYAAQDPNIKALRQRSKAANFGFPGGMGAQRFIDYAKGYGLELTMQEAKDLRAQWFIQWSEMDMYFKHISFLVGQDGMGTQIIPKSGFCRGGVGYSDAANGYFQTLAAHASKAAFYEVCRKAYSDQESWLYGSRPVAFVHDEIIVEVPEEVGHETAMELKDTMEKVMSRWTPDVPTSASPTLMRCWSKKAEPVYNNDRMVAWRG